MQRELSADPQAMIARPVQRAGQDPAFRRRLLAAPRAALAEAFGAPLPPGVEVAVLEETPTRRYLVLPPAPAPDPAELELDDLELALVGGGRTYRPTNRSSADLTALMSSASGQPLRHSAC